MDPPFGKFIHIKLFNTVPTNQFVREGKFHQFFLCVFCHDLLLMPLFLGSCPESSYDLLLRAHCQDLLGKSISLSLRPL